MNSAGLTIKQSDSMKKYGPAKLKTSEKGPSKAKLKGMKPLFPYAEKGGSQKTYLHRMMTSLWTAPFNLKPC